MAEYTIKEIAKMAQVSTGTVSRVINGAENIDPILYAKTMEVLRSTGYLENKRRKVNTPKDNTQTKKIGVITPEMSSAWSMHPLWNEYLTGIDKACHKNNFHYEVQFATLGDTPEAQAERFSAVDGLLIKNANEVPKFLQYLPKDLPIVCFGSYNSEMCYPQIVLDNYAVGVISTKNLINAGHSRIAFVNNDPRHAMFRSRECGYIEAMKMSGNYDSNLIIEQPNLQTNNKMPTYTLPDMSVVLKKLLEISPRPTAVIFANDWAAAGFYKSCESSGIRIPDDFSVCGVDNTLSICEILTPSLSSFKLPLSTAAEIATSTLIDMINGIGVYKKNTPLVQYLGGEIIHRNSIKINVEVCVG